MTAPRLTRARALALAPVLAALCVAAPAAALPPRASLPDVESQVMCVTCGVPLNVAESPQAEHERTFIRGLIARGETTDQIKAALVAQLGPAVLALPQRRGFTLAVYIVPVALIGALAVALAVMVPRWRRRGGNVPPPPPAPELSVDEADRLDADLARYPG